MTGKLTRALVLSSVAIAALGAAMPAYAQNAFFMQSAERDFNVPAQPLSQAALTFSQQAGVQLVLETGVAEGVTSNAINGHISISQALSQLLRGTSLTWRFVNNGTIAIEGATRGADGERVTGVVSVEGVQSSPYFGGAGVAAGVNGTNGSRDITATEGTGSFTSGALTIGSKVPQALKDVPQSISVLTSERMQQQNVTDLSSAMRQLPGVTLVQGETSLENTFYSRGFKITSIQIDGGAPLQTGTGGGGNSFGAPLMVDMSIYDHVELLRGAAGQFGNYGDPSGTVNLVRKKPLDHAQYSLEAQAGSWSNYRVVADATSPLAFDGRLRGRLVMTYQNNHHFYETAKDDKTLIYGIAELNVTPTTLIAAGINYTRQNSVPWFNGLPRYQTGDDLKLPRSTCLCFDWNRWDFDTRELFGGIEQKLGDKWTAKLNLTHNRQTSTRKVAYSIFAVNPQTGAGPLLFGYYNDYDTTQFSAEATLAGAFMLFGQRQEVTIGANRSDSDDGGALNYAGGLFPVTASSPYQAYLGGPIYCRSASGCPAGSINSYPPVDVLHFSPHDPRYYEPRNPLPNARFTGFGRAQTSVYINLRLTAFDRLHLTTDLHWSRFESQNASQVLCTSTTGACAGKAIGDVRSASGAFYNEDNFSWPPPISLNFDVTKTLTAYAGYTDIYQSQGNFLETDLKPLTPITGSNWEGGLKWAPKNGRLNASIAVYRIRKKGYAIPDPSSSSYYQEVPPGSSHYCCFIADPDSMQQVTGVDIEVTGELRRGLQVAASYTYGENKERNGKALSGIEGAPFVTIAPKHLYKLWMSYDFGASGNAGVLSGLSVSGGINGQSAGFYSGSACKPDFIVTNAVTGAASCPDKVISGVNVPGTVDYAFTVPPYAVVSARIDYRLSDKWSLAVNLENIFDKTYYQTVGGSVDSGNWYGSPRSVTASLRAKW